jgi:hypothetical protein
MMCDRLLHLLANLSARETAIAKSVMGKSSARIHQPSQHPSVPAGKVAHPAEKDLHRSGGADKPAEHMPPQYRRCEHIIDTPIMPASATFSDGIFFCVKAAPSEEPGR